MSYQLGQVQGALYAIFSGPPQTAFKRQDTPPPQTFRNHIKRLLDIDRAAAKNDGGPNGQRSAFCTTLPTGSGIEVRYETFDAFCLAIGLECSRFGFKQAEVVNKVRHIRPELAKIYARLEQTIEKMGSTTHVTDMDGALRPRMTGRNKDKKALDARIFLALDNLERPRDVAITAGLYTEAEQDPQILFGWEALQKHLDDEFSGSTRSLFIIELSEFSARLRELLERQAPIRRGPKTIDTHI